MTAAERLREQAKHFDLQAAQCGERIHEDTKVDLELLAAIQQVAYISIAGTFRAVADALDEEAA